LAILRVALEAHDRMRRAQLRIETEGETFTDRFGQVKPHPYCPRNATRARNFSQRFGS
jgi:hypothetical protein